MEKIASLRAKAGMTQRELAAFLDVTNVTVSNWEQGKHDPPAKHLVAMARKFDVHAEDIELPTTSPATFES